MVGDIFVRFGGFFLVGTRAGVCFLVSSSVSQFYSAWEGDGLPRPPSEYTRDSGGLTISTTPKKKKDTGSAGN